MTLAPLDEIEDAPISSLKKSPFKGIENYLSSLELKTAEKVFPKVYDFFVSYDHKNELKSFANLVESYKNKIQNDKGISDLRDAKRLSFSQLLSHQYFRLNHEGIKRFYLREGEMYEHVFKDEDYVYDPFIRSLNKFAIHGLLSNSSLLHKDKLFYILRDHFYKYMAEKIKEVHMRVGKGTGLTPPFSGIPSSGFDSSHESYSYEKDAKLSWTDHHEMTRGEKLTRWWKKNFALDDNGGYL
ncbi:MAG: hypothetical protein KC516_00375 [Nanoarchaeota archaeon]|nr:hypothetical protein [Nanoarchaeota archaeon]